MKLRLISHGKQSGEFILYNVWFLLSKLSVHDQYRNNFVLVGFYQSPLTLFILQRALWQFNRIGGGVGQGFFFLGPARLSTSHTCPAVSDVSKTRHNKCKALNGKNLTTKGILLLFFVCLFQFSLPFKFHSEIQRQMLVTSQRQSVSVLLHACIFHFQDAGRVGNQKLTLWVPQMCTAEVNHSSNAYINVRFCCTKAIFSTYTFLFFQYRNGSHFLGTWMQTHNEISESISHFSVEK